MNTYNIEIAEINSAGIRAEAESNGITHMRLIGVGYVGGRDGESDHRVEFFALPIQNCGEIRVANTNGDPVWEEADHVAFADLAASCGVEL